MTPQRSRNSRNRKAPQVPSREDLTGQAPSSLNRASGQSVPSETINHILHAFLVVQKKRLSANSFDGYENVFLSYKRYLNAYGFNALSLSEEKEYIAGKIVSESGSEEFCEVYGSNLLTAVGFLDSKF